MIRKIYILRNEPQDMQSFLKLYIQIFVDFLTFYLLEMKRIQLPLLMIIQIIFMYIYCLKVSILDTLLVFIIREAIRYKSENHEVI